MIDNPPNENTSVPSKPEEEWRGEFGEAWTQRNPDSTAELDDLYRERFGVTRTELMRRFLGDMDRRSRVLEVGANTGNNLEVLQDMGFEHLYGIDIQRSAVERAHRERPSLDIVGGNAFDIPFKDEFFDLVFTTGVLIHVPPDRITEAMGEIVRCSRDRIYGHEYYATEYTEIDYRGENRLLWKANFPSIYLDQFDVELRDVEHLEHADGENVDVEFTLEKQ